MQIGKEKCECKPYLHKVCNDMIVFICVCTGPEKTTMLNSEH